MSETDLPHRFPIWQAVGIYASLMAASALGDWLSDDVALIASLSATWTTLLFDVGLGLGLGALVVGLSHWASHAFAWARHLEREFVRLIGPLSGWNILILASLSAAAEEMFFRGVLQPLLGLIIASTVFGLLHFGPNRTYLPWTVMALAMGFALGAMAHTTEGLVAPIACHFTINLLNLWSISKKARAGITPSPAAGEDPPLEQA